MAELRKIIVKTANELPEETQRRINAFGDSLVEIRLSTNSPRIKVSSMTKIKGTFSSRLHQLLGESGLLKN